MEMALEDRIEKAVDRLRGPREGFVSDLDPVQVLSRICWVAEVVAEREGREPCSVIGSITGHGSGVSSAIYEVYRE